MRMILIVLQAAFLSAMAVIGAAGVDGPACPLPAPEAPHCEVAR